MQALDELVARWRKNPDPEATQALCAHLGTSREGALMREVGNAADAWHRDNPTVMLSVGRMYLDAGLLAEAQAAFVQAGKLAPGDAEAYRFVGEVLLRRGDAMRAEKALARAIKLGDAAAETRLWHERSIIFTALQQRKGTSAVADEVARSAPLRRSIPTPTLDPMAAPVAVSGHRPQRRSRPPAAASPRPGKARRSAPGGPARRRTSAPPSAAPHERTEATAAAPPFASDEEAAAKQAQGTKTGPLRTLLMGQTPVPVAPLAAPIHPPSPFFPSDSHAPGPRAKTRPAPGGSAAPARRPSDQFVSGAGLEPPPAAGAAQASPVPSSQPLPSDRFRGTFPDEGAAVPHRPAQEGVLQAPSPVSLPPDPELLRGMTPDEMTDDERVAEELSAAEAVGGAPPPSDALLPSPEAVLVTLAQVGLYETGGTLAPAWEAPPRSTAPRRLRLAAFGTLLTLGIAAGGYKYALKHQSARLARAQELEVRVQSLLESGSRADLAASEAQFQTLFELDSRSPDAALLWLQNRVLQALSSDDPVSGLESAVQRARAVGIDEPRLVFARLGSALQAGDLAGAGQLIAEWDPRARDDAWYQWLAGVVFERAGNPEALARYTRAAAAEPDLKLLQLMTARLAILQLGPEAAKSAVERATAHMGAGPATEVIEALAHAASRADAALPPLPDASAISNYPPLLQSTLAGLEGVRALRESRIEAARQVLERALGAHCTPALAAWLGHQALEAGDIESARTAATRAMKLSAVQTNHQTLAVRIALAEGRLKDAQRAAAGLDQSSSEAALIEMVTAYEQLRTADIERLLGDRDADATGTASLEALRAGPAVIRGDRGLGPDSIQRLSAEPHVWGSLVAVDLALDRGAVAFVEELAKTQKWDAARPAHAARMLRLSRYRGQLDGALDLVRPVLAEEQIAPRAIAEVLSTLIEAGRLAAAASAHSQHTDAMGQLGPWFEAWIDAASGQRKRSLQLMAELSPPAADQPLLFQVVALRALAAAKDQRAAKYHAQLTRRAPQHPELPRAAADLAGR